MRHKIVNVMTDDEQANEYLNRMCSIYLLSYIETVVQCDCLKQVTVFCSWFSKFNSLVVQRQPRVGSQPLFMECPNHQSLV